MRRDEVYDAIDSERNFQDARWGTIHEHPHEVGAWILIMEKLLADARTAWCGNDGDAKSLEELRKVAAVAVACGEQHGLQKRTFLPGALELAKQGDAGSIAKAAKREALEAVLAMREAAYDECEYDESCIGVAIYVRMIEAEMAKL